MLAFGLVWVLGTQGINLVCGWVMTP